MNSYEMCICKRWILGSEENMGSVCKAPVEREVG